MNTERTNEQLVRLSGTVREEIANNMLTRYGRGFINSPRAVKDALEPYTRITIAYY